MTPERASRSYPEHETHKITLYAAIPRPNGRPDAESQKAVDGEIKLITVY